MGLKAQIWASWLEYELQRGWMDQPIGWLMELGMDRQSGMSKNATHRGSSGASIAILLNLKQGIQILIKWRRVKILLQTGELGHPTPIHTLTLTHKHTQKVSKMRIFPLSDSIITDQWTDWRMDGLSDQQTKPLIELHVCTKNNNRSMSYFGPWSCMDDCKCKWEYAGQQSPSGWSPMMRWAHE